MPPKAKFSKEEIVECALQLVRREGFAALTARTLGEALGTSSRPIFTAYQSMVQLQYDVMVAAYALYHEYIAKENATGKYPPYKASGMAYIRFAMEEKELFKMLFMRERSPEEISADFCDPIIIEQILKANDFTREQAEQLYLSMWIHAHGIATMLVTAYFSLTMEEISEQMTLAYQAIRERMIREGDVK